MEKAPVPSVFKSILKILVTPTLLLGFYIFAPSWADSKIHGWIEDAVKKSTKLTDAQRAEELGILAGINMEAVCLSTQADPAQLRGVLEREGECARFDRFAWGWLLSAGLLAGLIGLLGTVTVLARRARTSRRALIGCYKLGWRLSITTALSKLLIQTPLLAYACFEFTVLLSDRYFPKLLLIIVAGAAFALFTSLKTLLQRVPMEFGEIIACEIERHENPALWKVIDDTSRKLGAEPPNHVIAGFTTGFYVTELSIKHSEGKTTGKSLYLSIPLMRLLGTSDIISIVGHELGHFQGEDTALSRQFYPLHFKSNSVLHALASAGWVGATAFHLLEYFAIRFLTVEQENSRERELAADRFGSQATSPRAMAEALVRVIVYGDAHELALHSGRAHLAPAEESLKKRDEIMARADFWDKLLEEKLSHPLDSHPKLSVRLSSLETQLSHGDAVKILNSNPHSSAYESWFTGKEKDIEAIEKSYQTAVEDLGSRGKVKDADYETSEGRALLDRHFPPLEWKVKNRNLYGTYGLLFSGLAICLPVVFLAPDPMLKGIFALLAAPIAAVWYCVRANHSGGVLNLNAAGMTYTGWRRPIEFRELGDITLQNVNGANVLTLVFMKREEPLNRHNLLPFLKRKGCAFPHGQFDVKSDEVIKTVLIYFHRALPESSAGEEQAAS